MAVRFWPHQTNLPDTGNPQPVTLVEGDGEEDTTLTRRALNSAVATAIGYTDPLPEGGDMPEAGHVLGFLGFNVNPTSSTTGGAYGAQYTEGDRDPAWPSEASVASAIDAAIAARAPV